MLILSSKSNHYYYLNFDDILNNKKYKNKESASSLQIDMPLCKCHNASEESLELCRIFAVEYVNKRDWVNYWLKFGTSGMLITIQ